MLIEMYADVVCPWGYVAKRQVDRALAVLEARAAGAGSDVPDVVWRPFLIDPAAPRPSVPLAQALEDPGIRAELDRCSAPAAAHAHAGAAPSAGDRPRRAEEVAAELGIGPGWSPRWRANSWAAQRLVTAAAGRGWAAQSAVAEALMHAHFVRGDDLALVEVLGTIAADFGLPAPLSDDGRSVLAYMEPGARDALERDTREAYLTGLAIGVETSPTFVCEGVVVARGAQPAELLAAAFEHAGQAVGRPGRVDDPAVTRLRHAEALIRTRNPYGALYLLDGLRPAYDGDRDLETATARALLATANLPAARAKLTELIATYPHDRELHWLLGHTLRRLGDPAATAHLAIAGDLDV